MARVFFDETLIRRDGVGELGLSHLVLGELIKSVGNQRGVSQRLTNSWKPGN